MIPYGKQDISEDDVRAVVEALTSDFLTQGPAIKKLEDTFADYCGVKYAVAVSSCTAALHLSCMALGLKDGGRLWTTPNTFVATANAGLYCGADVDFVDIDPATYLMCANKLEAKLQQAKKNDKLPNIVAPVHFAGHSCNMKKIHELSKQYGFKIIEDAAHCIGASYKDKKIGSCQYSDIACFSLHPVKIITSAEGGIVTTNDEEVYQSLMMNRTHGITKDTELIELKNAPPWYFEQQTLGYHYRITDIQCALGLSQMKRLDEFVEKRRELVNRYFEKLSNFPITLPPQSTESSWHLFVIQIAPQKTNPLKTDVFNKLREKGIGVNVHYIPVHTHPYYKKLGFENGMYPNAEKYYEHAITLPLFPLLTNDEQDYICDTLRDVLNHV